MKKRYFRRVFVTLSAVTCMVTSIFGFSTEVKADVSWPSGPEIEGESAIVMDVNSGAILFEKNVHEKLYPASITKILTTLIGIEECGLEERVFFSKDAVYKNEGATSHIARDFAEELSVKSTMYAIMLESANECAYALAEHVAGKYDENYEYFMKLMNKKAESLGCTDTHFNNANGLPDEDHYTSVYDMALISAEAYKNETFRIIAGTSAYTIADSSKDRPDYNCYNHHLMMRKSNSNYYEYVTGGKTGYTSAAGNTLVTFAEKDGMTLVCVVMKCPQVAYGDTRKLFDYCFENYKVCSIEENDEKILEQTLANVGILNPHGPFVGFGESSYIILPVSADFEDTVPEILEGNGKDVIARFKYTYGNHVVGMLDLKRTNARVEDSYFEEEVVDDTNVKIIKIKPIYIFVTVVAILLLLMIIHYIVLLSRNFYILKHDVKVKQDARRRERSSKRYQKNRNKSNLKFK